MSVVVTFNGSNFILPQTNEVGWGSNVTSYFVAIAAGCLQKTGGAFTLSAETDFGASFGLRAVYFRDKSSNPATAGAIRLGNGAGLSWRNFNNNGNLPLSVNSSDQLTFNNVPIELNTLNSAHIFVGNGSNVATDVAVSGDIHIDNTGVTSIQSGVIINAMVSTSAAIALSKLAALTTSRAVQTNSSTGFLETSTVTNTELGYVSGVTSAIQTQLNTKAVDSLVVHLAGNETITGQKVISPATGTMLSVGAAGGLNPDGGEANHIFEVVNNASAYNVFRLSTYGLASSLQGENNVHFVRMGGTAASPTATKSGDFFMSCGYRGHDSTAPTGSAAAFQAIATQDWTPTALGTKFVFSVTLDNTVSRFAALSIDGTGTGQIKATLPIVSTLASNQITLGQTHPVTLNAPTPAVATSQQVTFPDLGGDYNLIGDIAAQTIGGSKTFSSGVTITPTTNQLILGTTRTVTLTAPTPASTSRTVTFPDLTTNYAVVGDAGTQTIGGSKTFSSGIAISATSSHLTLSTSSNTLILQAAAQATSSRTWTIPDISGNGTFAALEGTQTFSGSKTFSSNILTASSIGLSLKDNSTNTVIVKATNSTTSYTLSLPTTAGASNQYLTTDGSGNCTWTNAAGTGTVNSGTAGRLSLYATSTNVVSDTYTQNTHPITLAIATQGSRSADLALTIPNPGNAITAANVVLDQGAYTIAGAITLSTALAITATSNHLTLSTSSNKAIITAATQATADRTYTIPDSGGNASFVMTAGTQTINGQKTFGSPVITDVGALSTPGIQIGSHADGWYVTGSGATTVMNLACRGVQIFFTNSTNFVPLFPVLGVDGSAANPSFTFNDDNTTGMSWLTTHELIFSTNGTEAFRCDHNQHVNIPNTKLQIGGNQAFPTLQVIQSTTTSVATVTSTSFTNTNLSASITPNFNTSKIKITMSGQLQAGVGSTSYITLARGGTNLMAANGGAQVASNTSSPVALVFYDSPSTTSATTYNVQIRSDSGVINSFFPATTNGGTAVLIVEEIAQ